MDGSRRGIKKLHSVAMLLWAPVLGLVYAITMPFIGIAAVTILGVERTSVGLYNALAGRENSISLSCRTRTEKRRW